MWQTKASRPTRAWWAHVSSRHSMCSMHVTKRRQRQRMTEYKGGHTLWTSHNNPPSHVTPTKPPCPSPHLPSINAWGTAAFKSPTPSRSFHYERALIYRYYVPSLKIKPRQAFCLSSFSCYDWSCQCFVELLWKHVTFEWCDCMFALKIPNHGGSSQGSRVITTAPWLRQELSNGFTWYWNEWKAELHTQFCLCASSLCFLTIYKTI